MPTYAYVSPTGHSEPSGDWHNPTRVYDGNWNNYADVEAHYFMEDGGRLDWWCHWLTLTYASAIIDRVRFKWSLTPNYEINIQIYNQATGLWDTVWDDYITTYAGENVSPSVVGTSEIAISNTTSNQIRIRGSLSGVEFDLYELDVRVVTPDSPVVPPPPNPDIGYEQVKQEVSTTAAVCAGSGARVRTLRRRTMLVPVIIG